MGSARQASRLMNTATLPDRVLPVLPFALCSFKPVDPTHVLVDLQLNISRVGALGSGILSAFQLPLLMATVV